MGFNELLIWITIELLLLFSGVLFDDNKNATDFFSLFDFFLERVWKPISQSSSSKNVLGWSLKRVVIFLSLFILESLYTILNWLNLIKLFELFFILLW